MRNVGHLHASCSLVSFHLSQFISSVKKNLSNLNDGVSQAKKSVDKPINFSKEFDLWPFSALLASIAKISAEVNEHLQREKLANYFMVHVGKVQIYNVPNFDTENGRNDWNKGSWMPADDCILIMLRGNFMVANSSDFHTLIFSFHHWFQEKVENRLFWQDKIERVVCQSTDNANRWQILRTNKKQFLLGNNRFQLKDNWYLATSSQRIT